MLMRRLENLFVVPVEILGRRRIGGAHSGPILHAVEPEKMRFHRRSSMHEFGRQQRAARRDEDGNRKE